jgi:hypothetical protein
MTQPSKLIRLTPKKLSRLRELLQAEGLAPASTTIPRRGAQPGWWEGHAAGQAAVPIPS